MRDFGQVHTRFWSSENIAALSDSAKLFALYLITNQHGSSLGAYHLPDGYIGEDIGWSPDEIAKAFAELSESGFARRCPVTRWVWVTKYLDWNPPQNPSHVKSLERRARGIPTRCSWLGEMAAQHPELGVVPAPPLEADEEKPEPQRPSRRQPLRPVPDSFAISDNVARWAEGRGISRATLEKHLEHFKLQCSAKGYKYSDHDAAFRKAVADNWARLDADHQPKSSRPALAKP